MTEKRQPRFEPCPICGLFHPKFIPCTAPPLKTRQKQSLESEVQDLRAGLRRLEMDLDETERALRAAIGAWQRKHCLHCPAFGRCHEEPVVNCSPENIRALFLEQARAAAGTK